MYIQCLEHFKSIRRKYFNSEKMYRTRISLVNTYSVVKFIRSIHTYPIVDNERVTDVFTDSV